MSEKIGQELHIAREGQNISLEQAAEETHIRLHYLEALESGDFDQLPSEAHVRGFLRTYAEYLGIAYQSLLSSPDKQEQIQLEVEIDPQVKQTPEEDASPKNSILIFKDLGEDLKRQREMLGFSLEEVERNTRVRQHYLEALESGDLDSLPSPVQGRGMLQNYAAFLGLDTEPILLRFADGLQAQLAEKRATRTISTKTKPSQRRARLPFLRTFPGDWVLGGILIVAVVAFAIWGTMRINSLQATPSPVETVPSIADALLYTPEGSPSELPPPTETPLPELTGTEFSPVIGDNPIAPSPEEITQETPIPTAGDAPVQIYVSILRRAWMRVTVDGDIEFEGRVIPGSAYAFSGDFQIELLTGNGAALQVFFNDTDLGILGVYGEVVYKVFTPEGELLPTPTITPVPTSTPLASSTVEQTVSP